MSSVLSETMCTEMPNRGPIITDEMLMRFHQRAPRTDQDHNFLSEDFEELRAACYLTMAVPQVLGGFGLTIADICRQQRRLAYYAPATALAINIHLYWTSIAAELWRNGDKSLEWVLNAAVNGDLFAASHDLLGALPSAVVVDTLFAWFLLTVANVYTAIARRALNLPLKNDEDASSSAKGNATSIPAEGIAVVKGGGVAESTQELEMVERLLDRTAQDWANGAPVNLSSAREIFAQALHRFT